MRHSSELLFIFPIFVLFFFNPAKDVLIIIFAALIHETGHYLAIKFLAKSQNKVRFGANGVTIIQNNNLLSYKKDISVFLSGPIFNIVFTLISIIIIRHTPSYEIIIFFLANMFFAVLNLLPVTGLDGGGALYSAICIKSSEESAQTILKSVSFVFCAVMFIAGIYVLLKGKGNISLLVMAFSLFFENIKKQEM